MARRRKEKQRQVAIKIGEGHNVSMAVDGEINAAVGIEGPGRASLTGNLVHRPDDSGRVANFRSLTIGPPPPTPSTPRDVPSGRGMSGYNGRAPGRLCDCGFSAYLFQTTCPKCGAELQSP